MKKTDEILDMIEDCIKRENKLSEWELRFIQSVDEQETISCGQADKLEEIWSRVT